MPPTAAGLTAGDIGTAQLRVIAETMAALPADVSRTDRDWAEAHLAEWAPRLDPAALGKLGARVLGFLDPDGPEPAADDKPAPAGELRLRERRNGVGFEGWLDGEHGPVPPSKHPPSRGSRRTSP